MILGVQLNSVLEKKNLAFAIKIVDEKFLFTRLIAQTSALPTTICFDRCTMLRLEYASIHNRRSKIGSSWLLRTGKSNGKRWPILSERLINWFYDSNKCFFQVKKRTDFFFLTLNDFNYVLIRISF